jgi:mediator of RNA polymerase II transcription subunit 5
MQAALSTVFLRPDLIVAGDVVLSRSTSNHDMQEDMYVMMSTFFQLLTTRLGRTQSFTRDLLLQLIACGLINIGFATEKDPGISKDSIPRLRNDAQESGVEVEVRSMLRV